MKPGWEETRKHPEALLLPYLTTQVLKKDPLKFLALLYARTRFAPEEWAIFDKNQTAAGWRDGYLDVEYAHCFVALHGSKYGRIVPWDAGKVHGWDLCAFSRAKLILEAQCFLMHCLRTTVEGLLDGVDRDGSSTKWTALVESGFRASAGVESWSTYTNQPSSSPLMDFGRLLNLARSRLGEANDHLYLLQTDPV